MEHGVFLDFVRTVASAIIAPHVERQGAKPSLGERRQLMAPGIPLGKAVANDDEGTRTCSATCIRTLFVLIMRCVTPGIAASTPDGDQDPPRLTRLWQP
jgi:hypothetical protein